jgi:hypothetical protein
MTPRERIKAVLNHQQPDRVPVDFGSTMVSGISVSVVSKVRKALGLDKQGIRVKVIEPYQMLGEIQDNLREKMFIDTIGLFGTKNMFGFENKDWKEWTTFDGTDVLVPGLFNTNPDENGNIPMYAQGDKSYPPAAIMPKGGFYFDSTERQEPIDDKNLIVEDNLEEFGHYSQEELSYLDKQSEMIYKNTDYAIIYNFGGASLGDIAFVPGPSLKNPRGIRGVEEWYISTVIRSQYILDIFEHQTDIALRNLASVYEAIGNRIEAVFLSGADFGTQRGPFISTDAYRTLFKPSHKRLCEWIHTHTTWKILIHSCGGIYPLIEDIIDSGFDIINPVQCSADGMDPQKLKEDFGSRVTFWGAGVDTQKTLPFGTPGEVYTEVSDRIRILNRNGGFVFNAIHNIQTNTPVENVIAMIDAIRDSITS